MSTPSTKTRPTPTPDRRRLAAIHAAVGAYHLAHRDHTATIADKDDAVADGAVDRLIFAEGALIAAILAPARSRGRATPEDRLCPSRGVRCDGHIYLVMPRDDESCHIPGSLAGRDPAPDIGRLLVVAEARLEDVGTLVDAPAV